MAEQEFITLVDDEGNEVQMALLETLEDDQDYIYYLLTDPENLDLDEDSIPVEAYRADVGEDGEEKLIAVVDDEELAHVQDLMDELDDEDDEEE